jgi:hypothetical protein
VRRATGLDATSLTARRRRAATVGAQRRPLKGMPDRHDNHLINVFSGVTQHYAGSTNSTHTVIQYTASSMTYTLSVALPHLLRYPVSDVISSMIQSRCGVVEHSISIHLSVQRHISTHPALCTQNPTIFWSSRTAHIDPGQAFPSHLRRPNISTTATVV